jgi:hypothetical protein
VGNQGFERPRISLEAIESSEQTIFKVLEGTEEPVVRIPFPGLLPDVPRGVEFRGILGEKMNLNEIFDVLQPSADSFRLVPGCVIHHQVDLPPFVVTEQLLDEQGEGVGIVSLDESEMPARVFAYPYCSHDFCAFATGKTLNLRPLTLPGPCSMQSSGLAE